MRLSLTSSNAADKHRQRALKVAGRFSSGLSDVAENHDDYLAEAYAGLRLSSEPVVFNDLDHLAGTWNDEETDAFDTALAEQRQIDLGLWE